MIHQTLFTNFLLKFVLLGILGFLDHSDVTLSFFFLEEPSLSWAITVKFLFLKKIKIQGVFLLPLVVFFNLVILSCIYGMDKWISGLLLKWLNFLFTCHNTSGELVKFSSYS